MPAPRALKRFTSFSPTLPRRKPANGVLLWFQEDAFDEAVERARAVRAEIVKKPHITEAARHRECWMRDPDVYIIVLASVVGDVGKSKAT